jgi:tetratricopeptide (TPR) repeat protein
MQRTKTAVLLACIMGAFLWMAPGCASDPNVEGAKLDLRNKDFDRALENVAEALARNPDNAEAHELKGQILMAQSAETPEHAEYIGLIHEMLDAYDSALAADPGLDNSVSRSRTMAYADVFRKGIQAFNRAAETPDEFQTAANYFELASEIMPDSAGPYVNRAFALLNVGMEDDAVAPLEMAIEKGDTQSNTFLFLGDIYNRQGNMEKAMEVFSQAAELYPENTDIQSQLLNLYVQTGQADQAMVEYQAAVDQDPNNEVLLYNYGSLLLEAERFDDAIHYLGRAAEASPDYANAYYNLGAAYINKAVKLAEQISEMDDVLREERGNLEDDEIAARESEMDTLAQERHDLFGEAIPYLETAKDLVEADGADPTGICQALYTCYVQTNQMDQVEAVTECAGYGN